MAAISVRNLDDDVKNRLRVRAAKHGRSMESEIRDILTRAANDLDQPADLFTTLRERFAAIGGVELDLPPRSTPPRSVDFE